MWVAMRNASVTVWTFSSCLSTERPQVQQLSHVMASWTRPKVLTSNNVLRSSKTASLGHQTVCCAAPASIFIPILPLPAKDSQSPSPGPRTALTSSILPHLEAALTLFNCYPQGQPPFTP